MGRERGADRSSGRPCDTLPRGLAGELPFQDSQNPSRHRISGIEKEGPPEFVPCFVKLPEFSVRDPKISPRERIVRLELRRHRDSRTASSCRESRYKQVPRLKCARNSRIVVDYATIKRQGVVVTSES